MTNQTLAESYFFCRDVAKNNSNFYLGMYLTARKKRKYMFAIYAWLRAIDDITDNENVSPIERSQQLDQYYQTTLNIIHNKDDECCCKLKEKYWPAFRDTVITCHIPLESIEGMVKGQKQDLVKKHYETFSELSQYCYYVASTVGLMCISIWGYSDKQKAYLLSEYSGIALQLTNILRDLLEDIQLHRVYLPAELVGVNELTAENFNRLSKEKIMQGVKALVHRNKEYYDQCMSLYRYINRDGRLSYLVLMLSYKAIFDKIYAHPEIVLSKPKIRLNPLEKITILGQAYFKSIF